MIKKQFWQFVNQFFIPGDKGQGEKYSPDLKVAFYPYQKFSQIWIVHDHAQHDQCDEQ